MRHLLFLFLDGVGLGEDDPQINPFARARMPAIQNLLDGKRLLKAHVPMDNERASLLALDANLGVAGLPQSATGQATLVNGKNVPAAIGNHYGPKPNPQVAKIVSEDNMFIALEQRGLSTAFLNAFPPGYFEAIASGRRLYGTIALAASQAGVALRTLDDLARGAALSADLSGLGLRERLGLKDISVISLSEAGRRLSRLAQEQDFSLFEYWLTDYAGHSQDMAAACGLLEDFDQMLAALLEEWDDQNGLILITSDHGNLEDLSTRRHTSNPVPCLIIGAAHLRLPFAAGMRDLTDVAPAIMQFFA